MLWAYLERRHLMFRTIVLAVDGSKYSEKAVELAKRLATATNDEVVVTHVTELLPARFQTYPGLDDEADHEVIEGVRDAPCTGAVSRSRVWFRPCLPAGMEHRGRAVSAMLVSVVDPDGRRQRVGG